MINKTNLREMFKRDIKHFKNVMLDKADNPEMTLRCREVIWYIEDCMKELEIEPLEG